MVSISSIEKEVNKNTMKVGDLPTKTGPQALQPDEVSNIDTTSKDFWAFDLLFNSKNPSFFLLKSVDYLN